MPDKIKLHPGFHCSSLKKNQMLQHTNIRRNVTERWKRVLEVCIYIQMDAESNDNTPAITLPPLHEDIYSYACVCIYKMHILGENTCQVSSTLHILSREACTHILMDAEHYKTTPRFNSKFRMKILMFTAHIYPEKHKKIHIVE